MLKEMNERLTLQVGRNRRKDELLENFDPLAMTKPVFRSFNAIQLID